MYKSNQQETAKEMATVIGKIGILQTDKLRVEVEIHDVKQAFGRTDYLVRPVAGQDEAWISSSRITIK